jgi:hexosaminidase
VSVIPRPASTTRVPGEPARVSSTWRVVADERATAPAHRFVSALAADQGIRLADVETGAARSQAIVVQLSDELDIDRAPPVGIDPTGGDVDERYRVVVEQDRITVTGASEHGVIRGLATLRQLLAAGARDGGDVLVDPLAIDDSPRFRWRGLSLDVVRCFFGPDQVRRVIDMLDLYKLNVLHLHLSDDQGWRLEVPGRLALTEIGGAGALGDRPGGSYTQAELRELVRYAADRGVTVVPEIDMPGHSGAAIRACPELADGLGSGPGNLLDPDVDAVQTFMQEIVEALAAVAPGPYVHVGGDEAFGMDPDAYARFLDDIRPMVAAAGKRMITWQEGARSSIGAADVIQHWMSFDGALDAAIESGSFADLELPGGVRIPDEMLPAITEMFRIGKADLARALAAGAQVILSPAAKLYLDKPYAEDPADPSQQEMAARVGLRVYPPSTIEESFDWDPATAIPGGLEAVAGIEAAMWGETTTTDEELEFLLLPRLVGVAEHAWAPPGSSWDDYSPRLAAQATIWRQRGWHWFRSSLIEWH